MLRTYVRVGGAAGRTAERETVCDDHSMGRTVLIVDDHPSFRASARAMLEAGGFDVVGEAHDGASALESAAELGPELVLLDVQLPDMTGFDVCAALSRSNGAMPDVILVSSRDSSDYGDLVAASRARGFVPKDELSGEVVAELLA
jgi:DNA-binding NarL/FixJ family response regulator